jgi:hypothetical protein
MKQAKKILLIILLFLMFLAATTQAQKIFIDDVALKSIQNQVEIKGSHHFSAYQALKWRIDQNDLSVYREDVNRYNRSYLAQELAFASLLEQSEQDKRFYANKAFHVIREFYENPEQQRFPHKDYGLSRAMMQLGLALPYNWCKKYWLEEKVAFVEDKIDEALDSWLSYDHANFWDEKGSNWVAVCRGGELVLLLASGQKEIRKDRYDFLNEQLIAHMQNGYGDHGATQEGMGYLEYGGTFLLKAVFAAVSLGDSTLYEEARKHAWWKLAMYAESFQPHERKFLMTGVAGSGGLDEGWSSLLLNLVPREELPYYIWFYDRHMGQSAPGAEQEKYDSERAGTIWSILYYPVGIESKDPGNNYKSGIYDSNGYFFFRNRWKDEDDILFSIMSDEHHHGHAWDQPEVFALNLMAYNTRFIGGPSKTRDNANYSTLFVDGTYFTKGAVRLTGKTNQYEITDNTGLICIDGGALYRALGLENAERYVALRFMEENSALICIVDEVIANTERQLTWQLNVGNEEGMDGIEVQLLETKFSLETVHGRVDGWVLAPNDANINPSKDPLQVAFNSENRQSMVLLYVHDGSKVVPDPVIDKGTFRFSFLDYIIRFEKAQGKILIQN